MQTFAAPPIPLQFHSVSDEGHGCAGCAADQHRVAAQHSRNRSGDNTGDETEDGRQTHH